ncbi:MAG: signal peptidase I, partial [Myxococcales bacterium]|nr:signal peptidase I [Myxococcales bacterium]
HVVPAGAQLSVDDTPWPHPVGEDGVLVPLNAGQQVNLRLEKDGYETVRRAMKGPAGGTENVYVTLVRHAPAPAVIDAGAVAESAPSTPPASARGRVTAASRSTSRSSRSSAPQQGNLEVAFIPAEARLFVDDQLQPGSSPRRVSGLSEGRHRLRLEAAGYVAQTREVEVEGGKTASVWFSLERAQAEQARLDVTSSPVGAEVRVDGNEVYVNGKVLERNDPTEYRYVEEGEEDGFFSEGPSITREALAYPETSQGTDQHYTVLYEPSRLGRRPFPAGHELDGLDCAGTDAEGHPVCKVKPDYVFCMGDNRDNSSDSRVWGGVPITYVKGKAMFVWWSWGTHVGVRWDRLGHVVH